MNYRGFSAAELELEYSPSSKIEGDVTRYFKDYAIQSAHARNSLSVRQNLAYGTRESQVLDYFPAPEASAPLHVFIHGGYWQAFSQRESAMMAPAITGTGLAFATLNYTLAPAARLGDMVEECHAALIWLAGQAKELGFDPSRVTLSGHSAGAHLAAMILHAPGPVLIDSDLKITDAILISGVYDLAPIAQVSVNEPLQLTTAEINDLSPHLHLPALTPHIRITVAEHDTGEFIRQSRDYAEHLHRNGFDVSFDLQAGLHHFDVVLHNETFISSLA